MLCGVTRTPLHCRSFVGGEFRTGHERFERRNPVDGEIVATADLADEATVGAAVAAAKDAFATWRRTTGFERGRLLRELARIALERLDDLAVLDDARDGQAARRGPRRGAQVRPGDALLRRGGRADRRRDDPQREHRVPVGRAQGAGRGGGRDHAVELPGRAGRLEARRRARRRVHDGPEGVGVHARRRPAAVRVHPRRGLPARRRQRRPRPGSGGRAARRAPGRGQDRLHGLQRHRAGALQDGHGRDPADDGARGQLPAAGLAPRRPRPRRGRRRPPLVPQRRADLHRHQPHLRRAPGGRRLRRARRRAHRAGSPWPTATRTRAPTSGR